MFVPLPNSSGAKWYFVTNPFLEKVNRLTLVINLRFLFFKDIAIAGSPGRFKQGVRVCLRFE